MSQTQIVKQLIDQSRVKEISLTTNGDVDPSTLKIINITALFIDVDFEGFLGITHFSFGSKNAEEIRDLMTFIHETVTYAPIEYRFNQRVRD